MLEMQSNIKIDKKTHTILSIAPTSMLSSIDFSHGTDT